MEINDQNLAQLSEVLKQTLNPDATERKKAEVSLYRSPKSNFILK